MNHLVKITTKDYRDFRRCYSRIEYSFFPKGQEELLDYSLIKKATDAEIRGKGEFLDLLEKEGKIGYFFKNDEEKIIGFCIIYPQNERAEIYEFAVFQKLQGLGREFYELVEEEIRRMGCKYIVLCSPFAGSQVFWKKMGFYFKDRKNSIFIKRLNKKK